MKLIENAMKRFFLSKKYQKHYDIVSHFMTYMGQTTMIWPKLIDKSQLTTHTNVLVLTPHPDDEVFGLGGVLLRLQELNIQRKMIWMTNGNTPDRSAESMNVLKALDMDQSREETFPFGQLRIFVVQARPYLKKLLQTMKPDAVFVPSIFDPHRDHIRLNLALSLAMDDAGWHGTVYQYEVWGTLIPNIIFDISDLIEKKRSLMKMFDSQMHENVIRYVERIEALNRYRGMSNHIDAGEAFIRTSEKEYCALAHKKFKSITIDTIEKED